MRESLCKDAVHYTLKVGSNSETNANTDCSQLKLWGWGTWTVILLKGSRIYFLKQKFFYATVELTSYVGLHTGFELSLYSFPAGNGISQ